MCSENLFFGKNAHNFNTCVLTKMCIQHVAVKTEELCIFLSEICFWVDRIHSMSDIGDLGLIRSHCTCCDL